MKFSVIIPVYNAENYIEDCIKSILSQKYIDAEIICVDDGSTDQSGAICDMYEKKHPQTFKVVHQRNQGQLSARCSGIQAAQGDYCLFLDADDSFCPDIFLTVSDAICRNHQPDVVIFPFFYDENTEPMRESKRVAEVETLFRGADVQKLRRFFFTGVLLNSVWTKAVKRSVFFRQFPDYSPFYRLRISEDRLFSMGIMDQAENVVVLDKPLYRYKILPGSISRQYDPQRINVYNTIQAYEIEKKYLNKWGFNTEQDQNHFEAQWLNYAIYIMEQFFANNPSLSAKKKIIQYNWKSFSSEEGIKSLDSNPAVPYDTKKIWHNILNRTDCNLFFVLEKRLLRRKMKKAFKPIKNAIKRVMHIGHTMT